MGRERKYTERTRGPECGLLAVKSNAFLLRLRKVLSFIKLDSKEKSYPVLSSASQEEKKAEFT